MSQGLKYLSTLMIALGIGAAAAQTQWPDFMKQLRPTSSSSPNRATLPADVKIIPPDPALPAERAAWSGTWAGWACLNAVCETRLAVEQVTADGANLVYVFTNDRRVSAPMRLEAKFIDGELRGVLPSGEQITYRMRSDKHLDFLYTLDSQRWVAGLLSRDR